MCLWRFQKDSIVKQILRFNGSLDDVSLVVGYDPVAICRYLYESIKPVSSKLYDKCVRKIFNIDDQYIYSVIFQNLERLEKEGKEFRDISNPTNSYVDTGVLRYVGSMYVAYGTTYRELAKMLNVSKSTIYNYIQALKGVDPDLYVKCKDRIQENVLISQLKLAKKF